MTAATLALIVIAPRALLTPDLLTDMRHRCHVPSIAVDIVSRFDPVTLVLTGTPDAVACAACAIDTAAGRRCEP